MSDNLVLHGRRVLVTRSREQAGELSGLLEDRGAQVSLLPLHELVPPDDWSPVDESIHHLDTYHWAVFTSTNSVNFYLGRMLELGYDPRTCAPMAVAAVGATTAQCLREYGLGTDLVPSNRSQEGLVEAFEDIAVDGLKILIPASAIGRELLDEALSARGATVCRVTAYENRPPSPDTVELPSALADDSLDLFIFLSPSSVRHFLLTAGEQRGMDQLTRRHIACIGPTTASAVRELGLEVSVQPEESSVPALVEAICDLYHGKTCDA